MFKTTMRAPLDGGCSRKRGVGIRIRIRVPSPALFLVVVVLFMLLVTVATDGHGSRSGGGIDGSSNPRSHSGRTSSSSSLPRKVNPFHTSMTHAKTPHVRRRADEHREPKPSYEDDKRIIHTGPNPLHN